MMFGPTCAAALQAKWRLTWERHTFPKRGIIGNVLLTSVNTDRSTRAGNSRRQTVLSQAERLALYGLPDFDEFQRAEFFAFTDAERALAERRKGRVERLQCLLQIGYFKAKNAFFNLSAHAVPAEDVTFLVERYLPGSPVALQPLTEYEQYAQRTEIAKLFGYRLWSGTDRAALVETAALLAKRDVTPTFVRSRRSGS